MLVAQVGTERVMAEPGVVGAVCPCCGYETEDKPVNPPRRGVPRYGPWESTVFDVDDDSRWRTR